MTSDGVKGSSLKGGPGRKLDLSFPKGGEGLEGALLKLREKLKIVIKSNFRQGYWSRKGCDHSPSRERKGFCYPTMKETGMPY